MTPHPPRPPLVLRIGIVGHRWDRLGPAPQPQADPPANDRRLEACSEVERLLATTMTAVLSQAASRVATIGADPSNGYAPEQPPRVALVSGMAEGADRIAARTALDLGLELWAVLPFNADEYRKDFDGAWLAPLWSRPGAAADFDELLARATATLEMDGNLRYRPGAYEPLGRAVLAHADLLLVVWDGDESRGAGGTADLVGQARREDIPIVRIDPTRPQSCWLEDPREPDLGRSVGLERLERRLNDLVQPPEIAGLVDAAEWNGRTSFHREVVVRGRLVGKSYGVVTRFFAACHRWPVQAFAPSALAWLGIVGRLLRPSLPADYAAATADEWRARWGDDANTDAGRKAIDGLAPIHGWLDHLARYYADRHRSAFTVVFSLAWIATVAAVLGLVAKFLHAPSAVLWAWTELVVMLGILGLTMWGKHERFHEKWISYRLLAEQFRHQTFLWPLGATSAVARLPTRPSVDDPRIAWTGWMYRAWMRQLGLPTARMSPSHLAWCRRMLRDREIPSQRVYHDQAAERYQHLYHVVHTRTEALFATALILSVIHFSETAVHFLGALVGLSADQAGPAISILSVFLPARAAALHGWAGHADFRSAALRSAQIELRLEQLELEIDGLADVSSRTLGQLGLDAASAMEGELGAWRATSLSRPLQRV